MGYHVAILRGKGALDSPYLFVLVMEVLTRKMLELETEGE